LGSVATVVERIEVERYGTFIDANPA